MSWKIIISSLLLITSMIHQSEAQDWANLERYSEANQLLDSTTADRRVVFMGNSITEGWINIRPDFFDNKPYINRGISGQTTPQMLIRYRQDVIQLEPAAVVILAGINDIAGNTGPSTLQMIADNIFSMAELAKEHNIQVLICSVLPAYEFSWSPGMQPAEKVVKLNEMLKQYCDKQNIPYIDYFSAVVDDRLGLKPALGPDGVHPNEAGYAIMEPIIETALAKYGL